MVWEVETSSMTVGFHAASSFGAPEPFAGTIKRDVRTAYASRVNRKWSSPALRLVSHHQLQAGSLLSENQLADLSGGFVLQNVSCTNSRASQKCPDEQEIAVLWQVVGLKHRRLTPRCRPSPALGRQGHTD
eukprot:2526659-Rhodomonas_salina.1